MKTLSIFFTVASNLWIHLVRINFFIVLKKWISSEKKWWKKLHFLLKKTSITDTRRKFGRDIHETFLCSNTFHFKKKFIRISLAQNIFKVFFIFLLNAYLLDEIVISISAILYRFDNKWIPKIRNTLSFTISCSSVHMVFKIDKISMIILK